MYLTGDKYRLRSKYAELLRHDEDTLAIAEHGIVVSNTKTFTKKDGSSLVLAKCHITDGVEQAVLWISIDDLNDLFEPYNKKRMNTTRIDDGLIDPKKDNRGEGDIIPPKPKKQPEPGTKGPLND